MIPYSVSDPTPSLTSPGGNDSTVTSTHGRGKPSHLQRTDINGVPSPQGGGMSNNPPPGFQPPGVGRGMGSASYAHATASGGVTTTFRGLTPSRLGQGGYGTSPQPTISTEFPPHMKTSSTAHPENTIENPGRVLTATGLHVTVSLISSIFHRMLYLLGRFQESSKDTMWTYILQGVYL